MKQRVNTNRGSRSTKQATITTKLVREAIDQTGKEQINKARAVDIIELKGIQKNCNQRIDGGSNESYNSSKK